MPLIALDEIDPPTIVTRARRSSTEEDAELQSSIATLGVLQPILVARTGNRYAVIAGDRRRRMAMAAGLTQIPAEVFDRADEGAIAAAGAAENMVRQPLDALDEWAAIVRLQGAGYTLEAAADSLGLAHRRARQLDKLGRLHPSVLELIDEAGELPSWKHLAAIANAPPGVQAKALKVKWGVERQKDKLHAVRWHEIAQACAGSGKRVSRATAIFDTDKAKLAWDEDFFAEPGSGEQFTTTDVAGFMKLQLAALKEQVAERAKKKQRVQIVECETEYSPEAPAGMKRVHDSDHEKPRRNEIVLAAISPFGWVRYAVAIDVKAERAKEKERAKVKAAAAKSAPAPASTAADADAAADDAPAPEPAEPEEPKAPFIKAGQTAIAAAKTEALRARLRSVEFRRDASLPQLIGMLVLALHAKNVSIRGYDDGEADWLDRAGGDLMRRLVSPDGHCAVTETAVVQAACEALARTLSIDPPDANRIGYRTSSGEVAEWIGFAAHADLALPRFDTLEILATVNGAELRRLAQSQGIKLTSVGELRKRLVGQLPDWRPAEFGAPGPTPAKVSAADMGNGDGEEEAA